MMRQCGCAPGNMRGEYINGVGVDPWQIRCASCGQFTCGQTLQAALDAWQSLTDTSSVEHLRMRNAALTEENAKLRLRVAELSARVALGDDLVSMIGRLAKRPS